MARGVAGGYHLRSVTVTCVRLFVYGSLKRGGLHHDELRGAPFLGEAQTVPGYALTEHGPYWAMVADGAGVVRGELFDVPAELLPALDEFEGPAYRRAEVALSSAHSRGFRQALAYFRKSD
jgi:gamma-glutamylcyclotransferase (GGCT)/AIG2-like uncharacterized protein YtfP